MVCVRHLTRLVFQAETMGRSHRFPLRAANPLCVSSWLSQRGFASCLLWESPGWEGLARYRRVMEPGSVDGRLEGKERLRVLFQMGPRVLTAELDPAECEKRSDNWFGADCLTCPNRQLKGAKR